MQEKKKAKKQTKTPVKSPEKKAPSQKAESQGNLGGLPSLKAPGAASIGGGFRESELNSMKEASKEILEMAKNLDREASPTRSGPPTTGGMESGESKVGGLFSSKAAASGSGTAQTSLSNQGPSDEELEQRKLRLKAKRDAMLKKKQEKMEKALAYERHLKEEKKAEKTAG